MSILMWVYLIYNRQFLDRGSFSSLEQASEWDSIEAAWTIRILYLNALSGLFHLFRLIKHGERKIWLIKRNFIYLYIKCCHLLTFQTWVSQKAKMSSISEHYITIIEHKTLLWFENYGYGIVIQILHKTGEKKKGQGCKSIIPFVSDSRDDTYNVPHTR